MDWASVDYFLSRVNLEPRDSRGALIDFDTSIPFRQLFQIDNIQECCSNEEPLVQAADVFTGMVIWSRNNYVDVRVASERNSAQESLELQPLSVEDHAVTSDNFARADVVMHLANECKKRKLGVGLHTSRCLVTRDPEMPINFWWYTPQHPDDKAPTRHQA